MSDKLKVMVSGCNGKMGRYVTELIDQSEDMEVLCGYDKVAREFQNFPVIEADKGLSELEDLELIPDMIIDFSVPECSLNIVEFAAKHSIPAVIATTGFTEGQKEIIKAYSADTRIFMSSNMSYVIAHVFVNLLRQIAPELADDFDIEVSEAHHNGKKDAPSGTAEMLVDAMKEAIHPAPEKVYGRKDKRKANEIGIASLRGGNVVGIHTVHFFGENESFELTHTAFSRKLFAEGALTAARFLINQESTGLYNFDSMN